MKRVLKILGDGQIWDVKAISSVAPQKTFEDLFSGRALGQAAAEYEGVFSHFKEKGRITGLSVTKALLSHHPQAKKQAKMLLEDFGRQGALGIKTLTKGEGFKENWPSRQRDYWKNLNLVVIGGGVSEGLTGKILVRAIKKYLAQAGLADIKVYQAKFPGKEAGFLGAAINAIQQICREAKLKRPKVIAGIGLDLGREEIGAGLVAINARSGRILREGKDYWLFKSAVKTARRSELEHFLDARQNYTRKERKSGEQIRAQILKRMLNLIIQAKNKAQKLGLPCARNIGVAVPGSTSPQGYILNSTDYLPFLRKKDGFNFSRSLEKLLAENNLADYRIHIINDGIAAGIANIYFGCPKSAGGKFAFLGVGSGLGGCVGKAGAG